MKLTSQITSKYIAAANAILGSKKRRRIVAYVESYDDVLFWRTVLSEYEDDTRYFEVMLPTRSSLAKGKKKAIMQMLSEGGGKNLIACVDADYDYLLQGASPSSECMLNTPSVFHTYVYSIENYYCYAPSLHDVCVMATLNDHHIFDFEGFLATYSTIIYPLFVWNILLYRRNDYHDFTMTDLNHTIELGNFNVYHPEESLARLEHKVGVKIRDVKRNHKGLHEHYETLVSELTELGVKPDNTYLYIQGHHVFDNVVGTLIKRVCEKLRNEREREIREKAVHYIQYQNELSAYSNSQTDTSLMLKKSMGYLRSPYFKRLQKDIEDFLCSDTKQH